MPHRKRDRRPFAESRRRHALAVLSGLFAVVGVSYMLDRTPTRVEAFQWLPDFMGPQSVGVGWVVAAVACFAVAAFRPLLHKRAEGVAWALAAAPTAYAAAIFFASWTAGLSATGYVTAAYYVGMAAIIAIVSGWPEEDRLPDVQSGGERGD